MKKTLFALLIAAVAAFACQKPDPTPKPGPDPKEQEDTTETPEPKPEHYDIGLAASFENYMAPATKTCLLDNGVSVNWQTADRLLIWTNEEKKALYGPSQDGASSPLFRYECPGGFYESDAKFAFVPSEIVNSFSFRDGVEFTLPAVQVKNDVLGFPGGINPAAASITGDIIMFKNVCSLLDVTICGRGTVRTLALKAAGGEYLCGEFCLAVKDAGTNSQILSYKGNGSDTVTLDCGTAGVVLSDDYIALKMLVPPGTYSQGFELVLTMTDGKTVKGTISDVKEVLHGQVITALVELEGQKQEEITASVENKYVKAYIDYVYEHPYTTSDFTVSYIDRYYSQPRSDNPGDKLLWGDRPAPVKISWAKAAGVKSYKVTVARDEAFAQIEYSENVSSSVNYYNAYNLIPGCSYYAKVTATMADDSTKDIYVNKINVTGRRRMIAVTTVGNVRDLGGLRTNDGTKQVKYGLIFRGSRLNNNDFVLSDKDKAELKRIGIKADVDLREDSADKVGSDIYGKGISPLGDGVDYKLFPTANKSYFAKLMTNDEYINALQWIINELKAGKPVYFHCKTGADRTGTLGFLIESLLDVSEVDKSIDYELTSFFFDFGEPYKYAFRSRSLSLSTQMGVSSNYDWGGMYKVINNLSGSSYQQKTYNYFKNGVGSGSTKISTSDLDWFISYMLEPVPTN